MKPKNNNNNRPKDSKTGPRKSSKTRTPLRAEQVASRSAGLGSANGSTLYRLVDKVEIFAASSSITSDEKPTHFYTIGLPVTDSAYKMRAIKVHSVKVTMWNRGAHDLYLEALQPFGAHTKSDTTVAWGPVFGPRRRPQSRWTMKANKPGGSFSVDLTDNNYTLPLSGKVTDSDGLSYLCLFPFSFAVTRNSGGFTGDSKATSSRELQLKIVMTYDGYETPMKAVLVKSDYKNFGVVSPYPKEDKNTLLRTLGFTTMSNLLGLSSIELVSTGITIHGKMYCDAGDPWEITEKTTLFALKVPKFLVNQLDVLYNTGLKHMPVTPTQGLVWKTDDDGFRDNIFGVGFGDILCHSDEFPDFCKVNVRGWYLATEYKTMSGKYYVAPILHGDTKSDRDVLNSFMKTQFMHSPRIVYLDRLMPFHESSHSQSLTADIFHTTKDNRLIVKGSVAVDSVGIAQTVDAATVIGMITIIIRVLEAALEAYTGFVVTKVNLDGDDIPRHLEYREVEQGFTIV